jgi:hypothetical protein
VDARRLHPLEDTDQTAAAQIRALCGRLDANGRVPLFVLDGGYDSAQLTLDLAAERVAVLVRLRSDRCFYADPPPAARSPTGGRPRRHGAKSAFADPATWPAPTATLVCQDDQYHSVTVQAWAGLHPPKQQRHPGHRSRGPRPIVRGTIVRVQVQRVPARTRPPKVLWLWWAGPSPLDLDLLWRASIRRFDLEHTVRFAKQTLGWTIPRPRTPEQADRWTWLVLAAYTQLRLARAIAGDQRLPWERPDPSHGCHRSPGRPRGRCSGPAVRYPAIKKPATKPRKKPTKTTIATRAAHHRHQAPVTSADGQLGTPARLNHKLTVSFGPGAPDIAPSAPGKVCEQSFAGKAMGLPVGAAAPSSS